MTIQQRIDSLRAQEVVARDTTVSLAMRIAADQWATSNEKAIRAAADNGVLIAQAFMLERLKAAHARNCDENCHSCVPCYRRTGITVCDKECMHTVLEDFDA